MAVIHVALAVILNQESQVLIAKRATHQHQGDMWEFPGGKVEHGENSQEALRREIHEEVGIQIHSATLLTDILHQYDDKTVMLDVYEVKEWSGKVIAKQDQPLRWVDKQELIRFEFPAANDEIIRLISP